MAHLDKLKVTKRVIAAAKPRRKVESPEYRRRKLIAHLEEQIELALLALASKPAELRRKRGHGIVTVRPRLWWKAEPGGTVFTEIRYNKVALNIAGRGTAIEVGPLKRLPAVYRTVIRAAKAGELDRSIRTAILKAR
jgi:hypothetical protein